jgi:hypothetical protein
MGKSIEKKMIKSHIAKREDLDLAVVTLRAALKVVQTCEF